MNYRISRLTGGGGPNTPPSGYRCVTALQRDTACCCGKHHANARKGTNSHVRSWINWSITHRIRRLRAHGRHVHVRLHRKLMPSTHRRRRRDSTVELRRVGGVNTIRNQLTTTADGFGRQFRNSPNTLHSGLTTWILIDIDNFLNSYVIMSSLVTNLNS